MIFIEAIFILAGIWQLTRWTEQLIRYVRARIESRIALRQLRELEAAAAEIQRAAQLQMQPAKELAITYWNGCTVGINRGSELGRLALLGAMLSRFDWHRRPSC